jgi:hypothetical protein
VLSRQSAPAFRAHGRKSCTGHPVSGTSRISTLYPATLAVVWCIAHDRTLRSSAAATYTAAYSTAARTIDHHADSERESDQYYNERASECEQRGGMRKQAIERKRERERSWFSSILLVSDSAAGAKYYLNLAPLFSIFPMLVPSLSW